ARLKTYGALFGDKNHKAFSRFCLCGHEKSGLKVEEDTEFLSALETNSPLQPTDGGASGGFCNIWRQNP
ncbi:hypothetical protein DET61_1164, partial [Marinobacter nauticus]